MTDTMNKYVPGSARYTSYVGGHCCWNTWYIPTYTENVNGQTWNIYQWILAQNKTDLPPVANAGSNITVLLPVDTAILNGTGSHDPDGVITSYSWAKVSGPPTITMIDTNTATPVISNLTSGLYTFKLTVTDNLGMSSNAQVQVLSTLGTLPLDFINFSGKNVGYNNILTWETSSTDLDQGNFELERSNSGSAFVMINSTPSQQKSVGSQSYSYEDTNVPDIISFYRIKYTSISGMIKYSEILQIRKDQNGVNFSYYPNPVRDQVVVQLQSKDKGAVSIRLIALDGKVVFQQQDFKSEDTYLKKINLGNISPGMYFISYSIGDRIHNVGKIIRD
jgi:Secretion system C-terminal sorting domain